MKAIIQVVDDLTKHLGHNLFLAEEEIEGFPGRTRTCLHCADCEELLTDLYKKQDFFPALEISREDLITAASRMLELEDESDLDERIVDKILAISDDDMEYIAGKIGEALCECGWFWDQVEYYCNENVDLHPDRIRIKEITITRAEGPCSLCGEKMMFKSYHDANLWLRSQSSTFPKGGCYDKHDFKIEWVDGETYEGRLDCKHALEVDSDLDVFEHVRDHVEFFAGLARNPWMGQHKYEAFVASLPKDEVEAHRAFLDKYIMPELEA